MEDFSKSSQTTGETQVQPETSFLDNIKKSFSSIFTQSQSNINGGKRKSSKSGKKSRKSKARKTLRKSKK